MLQQNLWPCCTLNTKAYPFPIYSASYEHAGRLAIKTLNKNAFRRIVPNLPNHEGCGAAVSRGCEASQSARDACTMWKRSCRAPASVTRCCAATSAFREHEDATSTTFTLLATTLSSAWRRADLCDPPPSNYDPPLASNLLVTRVYDHFRASAERKDILHSKMVKGSTDAHSDTRDTQRSSFVRL